MRLSIFSFAAAAGVLATAPLAFAATAGSPKTIVIPSNAAIAYPPAPPSLPKGVGLSVLSGDPAKPGQFVLRVNVPPHTLIRPHTHPTPETLTVVSGTVYHGIGKSVDRPADKRLAAGGFVYLPPDIPHYLYTTNAPTVLQVNGTHPFEVDYVKSFASAKGDAHS